MRNVMRLLIIVIILTAFVGCEKEIESNILSKTTWSYYYTTGGIFFPIEEHYEYLEFISNTAVRRYEGAANGSITGEVINGTYQLNGNIVTFNFPKSTLLATWIKATVSNDIITVEYDYGGTSTYKKK